MRQAESFDPLAYIENAFLDTKKPENGPDAPRIEEREGGNVMVAIPTLTSFLKTGGGHEESLSTVIEQIDGPKKFKRTTMSAPRPRRSKGHADSQQVDPELQEVWELLPKNVDFLVSFFDDSVTKNYYRGEFKESRQDLIRRLLDPELTLEETSRLLGVCPATVRRYTNREWLHHHRTVGGQRRFRLSDVVRFVSEHGRFPEES